MITFRLDGVSGVPTYLQLVQQVRYAVTTGLLAEGDQLPTVKEVVAALAVNPNTVLKAYRELEHQGLAFGKPGVGTFVRHGGKQPDRRELAQLRARLARWLADARRAGLDDDQVLGMVRDGQAVRDQDGVA